MYLSLLSRAVNSTRDAIFFIRFISQLLSLATQLLLYRFQVNVDLIVSANYDGRYC